MTVGLLEQYRVLIAPGLQDSGPAHWQSRWQLLHPGFERVVQDDWDSTELGPWSARVGEVRRQDLRPTLIVAHSFGCLATVDSIVADPAQVAGVLLVAPADPDQFAAGLLPALALPCPSTVIASSNDPWISAASAALWAQRWGSTLVEVGALGHINGESGLADWTFGQLQLQALAERAHHARRND
ncbi:alpha/beta hydrolase [Rugamonas sp.]|uniref:RBBP9/YdeN family alpha/beta hydrolase n=1 Tax=Rugamonas sp. TaxID=1926287 RepID=UPI0025F7924F|nr:alpha/beta hydrolase [Rugamonas sp.]